MRAPGSLPLKQRRVSRLKPALWLLAGGVLLLSSGCAAWRLQKSVELARLSEPWQQSPSDATLRLLVVGDSTGVGTGATSPQNSLAGLIGQAQPRWLIENRSQDGAKFADVVDQLGGEQHFDIVLVQAGGNDVIRLRGIDDMRADIDQAADLALRRGKVVIWMPAGNVGNAPFFYPPVSWWMTQRSRALHGAVQDAAARTGAVYVKLFYERDDDPFVIDRSLNAKDGLHPSDAGYRRWWQALKAHTAVAPVVSGARKP